MQTSHHTAPPGTEPDSLTRADLGLATMVFAAGLALLLCFDPYHAPIARDPATWSYMSIEIARGMIPHRDIFVHKTPGGALLGAIGAWLAPRLSGADPLAGARTVFLLLGAIAPALLYLVCKPSMGKLAALAAAAFMIGYDQWPVAVFEAVRPKVAVVSFGLAGILAAQNGRAALAGAAASASVLCWQPGLCFVAGAGASLTGYLRAGGTALVGPLARFALGGIVPVVMLSTWLAANGAFGDFIAQTIGFNVTYVSNKALTPTATVMRLADVFHRWNPLECVLLLPALLGVALYRPRPSLGVVVSGLAYLALTFANLQAWPDTVLFVPMVAAVLAAGLCGLATRGYTGLGRGASTTMQVGAIAVLVGASVVAVQPGSARLHPAVSLEEQRRFYAGLGAGVSASQAVVAISMPEFLIHNDRRSQWKWPFMFNGVDRFAAKEYGGFKGMLAELEQLDPQLIMLGRRWLGVGRNHFERWAAERYERREHKFLPYSRPIVEFRRKTQPINGTKN